MKALPKFSAKGGPAYGWKNPRLFALALTHRSYLNEDKNVKTSNERLEFLGDAIISSLTSSYLYQTYPNLSEGDLTNLRSLLIRTESLAAIAREIGLGSLLKLSKGEEKSGGRENKTMLANTFEAFIGALFFDQGEKAVSKILESHLFPMTKTFTAHQTLKDPKSLFQELVQEKKLTAPVYRILQSEGPEHAKIFTCGVFVTDTLWGKGTGRSKQEAEQVAAKHAIEKFRKS